jgi:Dyp-type peroxidase family
MSVRLDDIQTNVLRSVDPAFSFYVFFRISDVQMFTSFLASALAQTLTLAGTRTGLYSELARLQSHSAEAATVPSTHSHSLHMNIGFTMPGLERLDVERATRESFPEPFREGMAARGAMLGDVGASAPDHWDGYLGSRAVHGVLWWNWWNISKEYRLPGQAHDELEQRAHRTWEHIKAGARDHGIEVLHTETGVANYRQFDSGEIERVEHFGFRDGISQPWVDFGIADHALSHPAPGGGTPRQNGQWAPLAPGEFVLGYPDEDGLVQPWPCNRDLQRGGMYMVFRKLEQDVVGFRNFLRKASPDPATSQLLAAQMFGRWPDGTPLVQSPVGPDGSTPGGPKQSINDFRYERDDPRGRRCPISAHIRRANPRDTGGRNESRRHRLLRRGITYGGPILPEESSGDGRNRGVLFVALNARIDQQFEFVQSRWLNTGEFVGQVGAGRDPINAANEGQISDSFSSPSRHAPVTNLTRFVTMRGGDYFFVPGLGALRLLAEDKGKKFPTRPDDPSLETEGEGKKFPTRPDDPSLGEGKKFPAQPDDPKWLETSIGKLKPTPPLDPKALFDERKNLLALGAGPYKSLVLPNFVEHPHGEARDYTIVIISRYENVLKVLHDEEHFSVRLYKDAIARITDGENMIVGMPSGDSERSARMQIWNDAERSYKGAPIEAIIDAAVRGSIARCAPTGRLDVARDIGYIVPLELARSYYGIPGPDWLSPTAVAANFNKLEMTDVPSSWLKRSPVVDPQDMPFLSLQAWTRSAFAQVFLNVWRASELIDIAQRTTAELFGYIDDLIENAHKAKPDNRTLLGCMVNSVPNNLTFDAFRRVNKRIRLILAERMVGGTDTLNAAIVNIIDFLLKYPECMQQAKDAVQKLQGVERQLKATTPSAAENEALEQAESEVDAIIRECLRFNPVAPLMFRVCEADAEIEGRLITKGTLVCLSTKTAMFDPSVFYGPDDFRVDRPAESYLTFGVDPRSCGGQRIAETALRIVLKRLLLLRDFRRAAGPAGVVQTMSGLPLPTSMVVRFGP